MAGQKENWKMFIETTRAKAEAHEKVAQHWSNINTSLNLAIIMISAITTVLTAIDGPPKLVIVVVSGLTTLVSALAGFLKASAKMQEQCDAAKEYRHLMMKMIRCESDHEYVALWQQYNKIILVEPFLPDKYKVDVEFHYSMTPELTVLVDHKAEAAARGEVYREESIGVENASSSRGSSVVDETDLLVKMNKGGKGDYGAA